MQPDKISHFYIDTIDDLSYARTHYPNRLVRRYLNGISQILSLKIYKSQRVYWKNIVKFWKTELPLAMFEARREFLLSFIIMALSIGIGILSASHDEKFANYILGDNYVNKTQANINKGDPMAIYKDPGQAEMFLSITYNNIFVSVQTYLLSLFFGFGTLMILIYNGIMLGAFQYYFIERGLFFESFLTVWQHGTIEISCIVLAGTAGLVLAKGVLFPRTYSRLDAFRNAGRKSLTIVLGLMPLLVYSGAIEGFVTRYTEMHWVVRLSTILLSLGFVLSYFVWYPKRVAKTANTDANVNLFLQPVKMSGFSFRAIEKAPAILWKAVQQLLSVRKQWFSYALLLTTAIITVVYFLANPLHFQGERLSHYYFWQFFDTGKNYYLLAFNSAIIFMGGFWGLKLSWRSAIAELQLPIQYKNTSGPIFMFSLITSLTAAFAFTNAWVAISLFILLPFLSILVNFMLMNGRGLKDSLAPVFEMLGKMLPRIMGLLLIYAFFCLLLMVFTQTVINKLLLTFLNYVVVSNTNTPAIFLVVATSLIVLTLITFYTALFSSLTLAYFSIAEINSAQSLRSSVESMFPPTGNDQAQKKSILSYRKFS